MLKLNKEQSEAIEMLTCDLDELSNKPRRLFSAIRGVAEAFLTDDKERLDRVLDDIDEWEEMYYAYHRQNTNLDNIARKSKEIKKELQSRKNTGRFMEGYSDAYISGYKAGVEDAVNKMGAEIITKLLDNIYQIIWARPKE